MAPPRRIWQLLLPIVLLALVGVLAFLQYRWLGQVSNAERAELRASLERRARDMARDFDREVTTLQDLVRSATDGFTQTMPKRVPEAFDAWRRSARYPALVEAIYVGHRDGTATRLYRYNESTRALEPIAWPEGWPADLVPEPFREPAATPDPVAPTTRTEVTTFRAPLVLTDPLLYVVWLPTRVGLDSMTSLRAGSMPFAEQPAGHFVAIGLDRPTLTGVVLPGLVGRHFEGGAMRVAVNDADGRTVYATTSALMSEASADVRAAFFSGTPDVPLAGSGDTVLTWASSVAGRGTAEAGSATERLSRIAVRVDRQVGGEVDVLKGFTRPWQILVQHEAGSLEAAVEAGRRRNLWLSFGILSVLVAGMALVVVNARRSERLAAQQVDFVAAVSHELRTPLSVIRSAAQNLSSGVVSESGRTREYGQLIEREGRRLTEMVEQVLGYAGIDALGRGIATTDVDLAAVLDAALESCAPMLTERGVEVERDVAAGLPMVAAHEPALRRALENMIGNAVKYAADGQWIGLRVEASMFHGRPAVSVVVADRGPGIDPGDLPHVFEPFYRGRRAVEQQIQGSGIGLSLVRKVAETHGGTLEVQSSPRGTTFKLTLPAAATGHVRAAARPGESQA
jgi:signal transduction histidine kinase